MGHYRAATLKITTFIKWEQWSRRNAEHARRMMRRWNINYANAQTSAV